jgi:hypothetical protein
LQEAPATDGLLHPCCLQVLEALAAGLWLHLSCMLLLLLVLLPDHLHCMLLLLHLCCLLLLQAPAAGPLLLQQPQPLCCWRSQIPPLPLPALLLLQLWLQLYTSRSAAAQQHLALQLWLQPWQLALPPPAAPGAVHCWQY